MNQKEKAEELVEKYQKIKYSVSNHVQRKRAVACAIIAVDEIIKHNLSLDKISLYDLDVVGKLVPDLQYWEEVLDELNKML